jgi:hypothetical protein
MTVHNNGHPVDPVIVEFVTSVANRFGVGGLEDMIALASTELETARAALAALAEPDPDSE